MMMKSTRTLSVTLAIFFLGYFLVVNEFSLAHFLNTRIGHVSYPNYLWGFRIFGACSLLLAVWLFWAKGSISKTTLTAIVAVLVFLCAEMVFYTFDTESIHSLYYRNLVRLARWVVFIGFCVHFLRHNTLSKTAKNWAWLCVAFFLLDVATIYTDYEFIPDIRFNPLPGWVNVIYLLLYNLSILSCLILFLNRSRWFTYVFGALFIFCSFTLIVYQEFGFVFNTDVARMALTETQGADLGIYYKLIIGSGWKYALLFLFIVLSFSVLKRKLNIRIPKKVNFIPFLTAVGCFVFSVSLNFDYVAFHPVYKVPLVFGSLLKPAPNLERKAVYFEPQHEPLIKNVVLLVDESTTGSRFSLNGFPMNTTPYLESINEKIINFGVASSGFTRTYLSHMFLQTGIRLPDIKTGNLNHYNFPTIFQYAQTAGYKTIFIDGPYNGNSLIQQADLDLFIDEYISIQVKYPDTEKYLMDRMVIKEIKKALNADPGQPVFIYVKKVGTHYPFVGAYPIENTYFKPVLQNSDFYKTSMYNFEKIINAHNNAVRWSTDEFFKELLPQIQNHADTLITYTSDHGEAIESCAVVAYCHFMSMKSSVPLILFPSNIKPSLYSQLIEAKQSNFNRLSHFEIFPSLLWFFGFDKQQINESYGPTVLDQITAPRYQILAHSPQTGESVGAAERRRAKFALEPFQVPDLLPFYQNETSLLKSKN